MPLPILLKIMRDYLSPDWTTADRADIRKYALTNLRQRGIDTFSLVSLDLIDLIVQVELLAGERSALAA